MKELMLFLTRAAAGDQSPPRVEVDQLWHRLLQRPKAYRRFCLRHFGVVIEHMVSGEAPSPGFARCRGHVQVPLNEGR